MHDAEERNEHVFNLQQNQTQSKERLKSCYESMISSSMMTKQIKHCNTKSFENIEDAFYECRLRG